MKNLFHGGGSVVALEGRFIFMSPLGSGPEAHEGAEAEQAAIHPDAETQESLAKLARIMDVHDVENLTAGDALNVVAQTTEGAGENPEALLSELDESETGNDLVADAKEFAGAKPDQLVFAAKGKPAHIQQVIAEMTAQFGGTERSLTAQMQAMEAMNSFDV